MGPAVQTDAGAKNRSLLKGALGARRVVVRVELLFWRHLISKAVYDAKKTVNGLPTDLALLARFWIEKYRPAQADRVAWETSFECACTWLNLDPQVERPRLIEEIEVALLQAYREYVRCYSYQRSAAVLSCAGIPTAIERHFALPLVAEADYDDVAGIDHGDPKIAAEQLARLDAAMVA